MKPQLPSLAALSLSLLLAPPALAMDKRQADAACGSWTLECPEGATSTPGPAKKTGPLECKAKVKERVVKEGPAVVCKNGEGQAFGDWKEGKKHGRHVTMSPDGSWTEEDFVEGKLEGRQVKYSAEGQLLSETHFQGGKKHGRARTYSADGRLASEELWDKGLKGKKPEAAPARAATPEP
ncbi:toxin-antitoxin system YwqK family antitoxin [Hyalangium rubrum]|uniref:MORN repeat protein n=1 Tax=Hyalangium rubrum TaxID=3103134 RepID=A0ABU5H9N5_9BACT|nr:hypothetical protein [Hyalangium sp. s54d21]MDY7230207.1 hypothetical protein [Hyalangium sp. s54d21]